jgi:hypothetical protein
MGQIIFPSRRRAMWRYVTIMKNKMEKRRERISLI